MAQAEGVALNTGTPFARDRANKQLAFSREKAETTELAIPPDRPVGTESSLAR